MSKFELQFKPFGDSALLIEWPPEISKNILDDIRNLFQKLDGFGLEGVSDINFVYRAMLVNFDKDILAKNDLIKYIKKIYKEDYSGEFPAVKTWHIPVCYDLGFDLDTVLTKKGLHKKDFISLHSAPYYRVYGIGFLPGFLYLGGLSTQLEIPRKEVPLIDVFKGAVAIGGRQTGIYPQNSPGGWYIIGKTPIRLFDRKKEVPTFIKPGDKLKFYPVSKAQFQLLEIEIESDVYDFNKEIYD
jgi:inhibitor of KinA